MSTAHTCWPIASVHYCFCLLTPRTSPAPAACRHVCKAMPQEDKRDCNGRCVLAFKMFPKYFGGYDDTYTLSQYASNEVQGKLALPEFLDDFLKSDKIAKAHIVRDERNRVHSNWARFVRVPASKVGHVPIAPACPAVSDGALSDAAFPAATCPRLVGMRLNAARACPLFKTSGCFEAGVLRHGNQ